MGASLGRCRAKFGRVWSKSVRHRLKLANVYRFRGEFGRLRYQINRNQTNLWSSLARPRPLSARFRPILHALDQISTIWTGVGPMVPNIGLHLENLCSPRSGTMTDPSSAPSRAHKRAFTYVRSIVILLHPPGLTCAPSDWPIHLAACVKQATHRHLDPILPKGCWSNDKQAPTCVCPIYRQGPQM